MISYIFFSASLETIERSAMYRYPNLHLSSSLSGHYQPSPVSTYDSLLSATPLSPLLVHSLLPPSFTPFSSYSNLCPPHPLAILSSHSTLLPLSLLFSRSIPIPQPLLLDSIFHLYSSPIQNHLIPCIFSSDSCSSSYYIFTSHHYNS